MGGWGVIHNAYSCVQGKGMSRLMCTYALTLSIFMLLPAVLSYNVLFYLYKFNFSYLYSKKMYSSETFIFLQWDQFLSSWNKLLLLKIIFADQIFLVKIWTEKRISIAIHPEITYFWIWLFCGPAYQGWEEVEGVLMRNLCLIRSHHWYDMEKLTVPLSSNLNLSLSGAQQKLLC